MKNKPPRDWAAVLTDAKARGLHPAACAKEQNVCNRAVHYQEERLKILLPRKHPSPNPNGPASEKVSYGAFLEAAASGEGANAFCLRLGICANTLYRIEKQYGVRLSRDTTRKVEQEVAL